MRSGARGLKDYEKPRVINTDKAPTYGVAIAALKAEVYLIERAFGLGADMLSEVFEHHRDEIEEWAA